MPKPYSLDLRERVVSYVEAGHSRRAAAAHFRVSPSFVINLMTAFRERGAVAPKSLGGCNREYVGEWSKRDGIPLGHRHGRLGLECR